MRPTIAKWFVIGISFKRWIALLTLGLFSLSLAFALVINPFIDSPQPRVPEIAALLAVGIIMTVVALVNLSRAILAPYRRITQGDVIDVMVDYNQRSKGIRVVAIGGGTGLPATLRGVKPYTGNITAIVTVADDGGSSGRLRREMGVLPPGDLRNNIVALSDDESLMSQLFQYRFESGELSGHAFGNLFIAALASVVSRKHPESSEIAEALSEVERVLNIRGRVIPATLDDVRLTASVRLPGSGRLIRVIGESHIGEVEGHIEEVQIEPPSATAYAPSVQAIMDADVIVIGPGSLYTSILPNLLVSEIADALRATKAYKIYVCNVATQPVETEGYTVAEHVMALERHIGRGVFQAVIANNAYPQSNAGENTRYVQPIPPNHEILQRYEVRYTDLAEEMRPWRHDPQKLGKAIMGLVEKHG
jgi:uncharacterized cofD-like protein